MKEFARYRGLSQAQVSLVQTSLAALVHGLANLPDTSSLRAQRQTAVQDVEVVASALLGASSIIRRISSTPIGAQILRIHLPTKLASLLGEETLRKIAGELTELQTPNAVSSKRGKPAFQQWVSEPREEQVLWALLHHLGASLHSTGKALRTDGQRLRKRPLHLHRLYAVWHLKDLYQTLYSRQVPRSSSRDFDNFCEACFGLIGMETRGLDAAVRRIFSMRTIVLDADVLQPRHVLRKLRKNI